MKHRDRSRTNKRVSGTGDAGKRSLMITLRQRITGWAVMILMMMVFVILVASTPKFAALKPDGFSSTAWEQLNGTLGYLGVGTLGLIILFGFEGSSNIKTLGRGVLLGILAPFILVLIGAVPWPGIVHPTVLPAALPPAIGATSGMAFCLLIAG